MCAEDHLCAEGMQAIRTNRMPSLGGCQVQEGCQPQDLTRPLPPSQPYLQPRSVPLSTPSFAPTGSDPHRKPVRRFRQLLAAQAQCAWHCLSTRASRVRRRSDEGARCLSDSERLRSRAARASGCSRASSFPCRWVSTLSRILSHGVAARTCSVYSLLRDESILPPLQGCGKTYAKSSLVLFVAFSLCRNDTQLIFVIHGTETYL